MRRPVNSRLLSDSGGPCQCSEELAADFACRFYDPVYDECVENFRRQLVTVSLSIPCFAKHVSMYICGDSGSLARQVTAVSAFLACFMMGAFANLPFALAPGMGLNAYFTVCKG
jgi:AGZA family xanthine/uracil permease-like MFS transporter